MVLGRSTRWRCIDNKGEVVYVSTNKSDAIRFCVWADADCFRFLVLPPNAGPHRY